MTEMKALLRFPAERKIALADCPVPTPGDHDLLVQTSFSVISPGTEFTQARQATASLLQKAWQRPDLVALTLKSLRQEGARSTVSRVNNRLGQPMPMGYCAVGKVVRTGSKAYDFAPGQRVAIAGMGSANHAQCNRAPINLACPVPDTLSDQKAAFATLYALALHAIRQGKTTIGDHVAIIGAGLIGQLLCQTAVAAGTNVTIIEPHPYRRELAQENGANRCFTTASSAQSDVFDAVYICAPARGLHKLVDAAARLCRDRATIICVGDVAISAQRKMLYDKEIAIKQVRSYGPGRYDPAYEELGQDYPVGYVRWTIKRNMEAALDLMAKGRLDPTPLITKEIAFENIADHFAKGPDLNQLATLVRYGASVDRPKTALHKCDVTAPSPATVRLGMIGTGNYAGGQLVPHLIKQADINVLACCSQDGISALAMARKLGDAKAVSSAHAIINNPRVNSVIIATRHDSHAKLAADALAAGKHVWLEKPIAIDLAGIGLLRDQTSSSSLFMVGHNRRYAPMSAQLRAALPDGARHFRYRVRISPLPNDHWLFHSDQGGRTIGEITHFIDLIHSLTAGSITDIHCHWLDRKMGDSIWTIRLSDGSQGEISYQHTSRREAKETLQIDAPGFDAELTDWKKLTINGKTVMRQRFGQDKGQAAAISAFTQAVATGQRNPLIPRLEDEISLMSLVITAANCG
ncbi:bi-domain-containing oxidoreductase [Thalassospira sp. SM2505]